MTQIELIRCSELTENHLYGRRGQGLYGLAGNAVYGSAKISRRTEFRTVNTGAAFRHDKTVTQRCAVTNRNAMTTELKRWGSRA